MRIFHTGSAAKAFGCCEFKLSICLMASGMIDRKTPLIKLSPSKEPMFFDVSH